MFCRLVGRRGRPVKTCVFRRKVIGSVGRYCPALGTGDGSRDCSYDEAIIGPGPCVACNEQGAASHPEICL